MYNFEFTEDEMYMLKQAMWMYVSAKTDHLCAIARKEYRMRDGSVPTKTQVDGAFDHHKEASKLLIKLREGEDEQSNT